MKGIVCFISLIFILGAAEGNTRAPNSVTNYISLVLENLRVLIRDGHPANGIPPRDPLQLGGVHVEDLTVEPPGIATDVSADYYDMTLGKLSDFRVDTIEFEILPRPHALIQIVFPYLALPVEYNVEGQVNGVPEIGSGKLLNEVTDVAYNFTLLLGFSEGSFNLTIEEVNLNYTVASNIVTSQVALGDPTLNTIAENNFRNFTEILYNELIPGQVNEIRDAIELILENVLSDGGSPLNLYDTTTSLFFVKKMIYYLRTTLHI